MKRYFVLVAMFAVVTSSALAETGMWIPMLIKKNIAEMQRLGLKLSAEDIYDVNNASLKDAVVIFGGGCTGEIVSEDGLLFTNYHCGYEYIQKHSSVEHDYLADGFWAMSRGEELPNEDLSVMLLNRIEDVSDRVNEGLDNVGDYKERNDIVNDRKSRIAQEASVDGYKAVVENTYGGNQFFLYVYEVFEDVRMVGAPPASIGKFGGDTDNWVWPRHTGDFSIFRIYASKDNKPAKYSEDNVPYKPKRHLKINRKGLKEGDFTMVMGYPGTTKLYSPACYIDMVQNVINPCAVGLRTEKLKVMNSYQNKSQRVNIQYAAKNAHTSNAWKKWQGEIKGLKKIDAVNQKHNWELDFRKKGGAALLDEYDNIYTSQYAEYETINSMLVELYWRGGIELCDVAEAVDLILYDKEDAKVVMDDLKSHFYKDFDYDLSVDMAATVMEYYCEHAPRELWPESLLAWKGSVRDFIYDVYKRSVFSKVDVMEKILDKKFERIRVSLVNDPAYVLNVELYTLRKSLRKRYNVPDAALVADLNRRYIKAVMDAYPDSVLPPDANFTMRVSYGKVAGYEGDDAVVYAPFTTLDGIVEKYSTGEADFEIPERLKELYDRRDFGSYAAEDGKVYTAFVATNHTTGGNSGSPVLDAEGNLVGLNFDRAWNGVMSDLVYNPVQCRNITLDIRYLLFVVDKFAGAGYLIDELDFAD